MKKILGLIILTTMCLTACQLQDPTIYTNKPQASEMSDIAEIKKVYQYDMMNEQQQFVLNDLEHQMNQLTADKTFSNDQKQKKVMAIRQQYLKLYQQNHQQNIDDFVELIDILANVDIRQLPEEIRQQYIMNGEVVANKAQLEKFNESMPALQTLKMINDTYRLNISHYLLK